MRGTVTSVGLNLRARAHAAAHIIDQISKGDQVEILGAMPGGWLKVEVVRTGERGYVFAKFVKADPAPAVQPDVEPVPPPDEDEPTDPRVWIVSAIGLIVGILAMLWAAFANAADLAPELILPDPKLTPGVAVEISLHKLCTTKWGKDHRAVTAAMKREVFAAYGLTGNTDRACVRDKHGRRCEIDHLISRELGGADDTKNLWPQPYGSQPWNAVMKDRVENRLHKEVCTGNLTLKQAQDEIARDWRVPYRRYFGHS